MNFQILPPDNRRIISTCLNDACPHGSNEYDGNYLQHTAFVCGGCGQPLQVKELMPDGSEKLISG